MTFVVSEKLEKKLKEIILTDPYDIYHPDSFSENFSTSSLELCSARDNEFEKAIGSANLYIACEILDFEVRKFYKAERGSVHFYEAWSSFIGYLKESNFVKDTPETTRQKFKLVVDNS